MDQIESIEARESDHETAADYPEDLFGETQDARFARLKLAGLGAELVAVWEQGLADPPTLTACDHSKLAAVEGQLLADPAAALDPAEALRGDHFVFAEPARVAASLALGGKIAPLLEKTAGHCTSAAPARQFADRRLVTGCDWETVRGALRGPAGSGPGCARAARLGRWGGGRISRLPVGV